VRDHHEAFLKPNLKFGITKEEARKREASEPEEAALVEALREDFHDIFAFALLSGIRETGLCTLERSKVDLRNAQVTFRSKRHRGARRVSYDGKPRRSVRLKWRRSPN
jgi:integrase